MGLRIDFVNVESSPLATAKHCGFTLTTTTSSSTSAGFDSTDLAVRDEYDFKHAI